jgi:siroheme synthase
VLSSLGHLAADIAQASIESPAILIIGDVVQGAAGLATQSPIERDHDSATVRAAAAEPAPQARAAAA